MKRKASVVIFQREPEGLDLSYEDMTGEWKRQLEMYPEIGSYKIIQMTAGEHPNDFKEEIGDADAVFGPVIYSDFLNEMMFVEHPNLKYVATLDHGYEIFDKDMTRRHGVTITNTIYGDWTIAQYAMALLLNICHDVSKHSDYVKNQYWLERKKNSKINYEHLMCPQIELFDKRIGIVGLGNIGLCMAKMSAGMGMKVMAYSRTRKEGPVYDFIEQVSFEDLLENSDVIPIHCPLTEQTFRLFDKQAFGKMKSGVILINTARGGIIDEDALMDALNCRRVYKAGLDVISEEPPEYKIPLMESPYTYITPHIAWQPREARLRAIRLAVENYMSYLRGCPQNIIN